MDKKIKGYIKDLTKDIYRIIDEKVFSAKQGILDELHRKELNKMTEKANESLAELQKKMRVPTCTDRLKVGKKESEKIKGTVVHGTDDDDCHGLYGDRIMVDVEKGKSFLPGDLVEIKNKRHTAQKEFDDALKARHKELNRDERIEKLEKMVDKLGSYIWYPTESKKFDKLCRDFK